MMKKGRKILIIAVVLLLLTVTVSAAMLHYDYDGDGKIGSRDAIYLAKHIADPDGYPLNPPADADGSGQVTQADALYLLRHSLDPERYPLYIDHTPEIVPAKEATCTENGLTEGVRCAVCHEILTAQQEIPALGHDPDESLWLKDVAGHWRKCRRTVCAARVNEEEHSFTQWLAVPAGGCSLQDYHVRACLTCGHCETDLDGDVLHAHQWALEDLAPTCTEPGYRHRVYCVNCDTEVHKIDEPALGHDWEGAIWSITPLTHSRTCQRKDCGYIEKGNHLFGAWITESEATCTVSGSRYRDCTVCPERVYEPIPAKHELVYTEAKEPTCTEKGWFAYESCTRCTHSTYEERPALGHFIDESIYQKDDKNHWQYCQRSGCDYIQNENAHSFGPWVTVQEQTCTQDGISERTCTVCKYKETNITKAKHNYDLEHWITDDISHWHQCTNCGNKIDVANHKPGQWTVTVQPTCETVGKETTNCQICDALMERTITITHDYTGAPWSSDDKEHWHNCIRPGCTSRKDVAQHSWGSYVTDTPATCETDGQQHRNCTVCHYLQTEIIPAKKHSYYNAPWQMDANNHWKVCIREGCNHIDYLAPHKFGQWTVRTPSTCTEAGEEYRVCSCGYEETRALPIPGHDLSGNFRNDENGHWQVCSRCQYQTEPESHSYGRWMVTKEESCTTNGQKNRTCTVCHYTEEAVIDEIDGHLDSQWLFDDDVHYKHCDRCQTNYHYKSHEWEESTVDATCTTATYSRKYCDVCKHEIKQFIGNPLGHRWKTDYDEASHWEYCDRPGCGEVKPQQPHSMGQWKTTVAAGCEEKGEEKSACSGCGYTITRETGPVGHNFVSPWIDHDSQTHYQKCERCTERNYAKHSWTVIRVVPPECEKGDYTEYKCSDCGRTENRDYQDPLGHTDGKNDTNWYTENPDNHWLTCIRCGKDYKVAPHSWSDWICDVKADCENPGNEYRTCTVCNRREDKTIPAEGHDHSGSWIQGDSTHYKICGKTGCGKRIDEAIHSKGTVQKNDTHHWYTCTVCGKTPVDQAAHTYGDWETETPASCTSEGLQKRYCTVCDQADSQTKILTIIPHDLYFTVDTRQIQQTGEIVYEHTVVEKCRYKCDYRVVIGDTVIHIHNEVDTIVTPATCTENGSVVVKCKVPGCGDVFLTQELPALGHDFVDGICIRCGLGTSQGLEYVLSDDGTYYIVTGIGTCTDTEIVIPDTHEGLPVKEIGKGAFAYNDTIVSVIIPNSVTRIRANALRSCENLKNVILSNSVKEIDMYAFAYCDNLTEIVFPKSMEVVDSSVVVGCDNLTSIQVKAGNSVYHSAGNCLIRTASKTLIFGCNNSRIPTDGSVTHIGSSSFDSCRSLTEIVIPDSVSYIGQYSFNLCISLKEIVIPDGVTGIEPITFQSCIALEKIRIPDSVTIIGDFALSGCRSLTEITIPTDVTYIGEYALQGCTTLKTIYYKGTTEQWNNITKGKNWDYGCNYTLICLGDPQPSQGLEYVLSDDGTYYIVAGIGTCTDTEIIIPDTHEGLPVKEIGDNAFERNLKITGVTLPEGITAIGNSAFLASGLTELQFPESLTHIGEEAFAFCDKLTEVTIGGNVTTLGDFAFYCCQKLNNVYVGKNVSAIGLRAFELCITLEGIWVDAENEYFCNDQYGVLLTKDMSLLMQAPFLISGHYQIPKGVVTIGTYAFHNCSYLTSVTFPDSVTTLEQESFMYCPELTSLTLGKNVTTIGDSAFERCSALTEVTFPNTLTSIGVQAFRSCNKITTMYYEGTTAQWRKIQKGRNWDSYYTYELICLWDVNGSEGLEYILGSDGYFVAGIGTCTDTEIVIPDTYMGKLVVGIDDGAFQNETSITSVTMPDSVMYLGSSAFSECTNLKYVALSNNIWWIGQYAFYGCTSLTEITIPDSASSIGMCAFYCCTSLKKAVIGQNVTRIDRSAFECCKSLTEIVIPDKVSVIGESAFGLCYGATSITIGKGVIGIGNNAFSYCKAVTSITIPKGAISIGKSAFGSCTSLASIQVESGNTVYHSAGNCLIETATKTLLTGCKTSQIPADGTVTVIGKSAFGECTDLRAITIPEGVTNIGESAFYSCCDLEITIPVSVTSIGDAAMTHCSNITVYYMGTSVQWEAITKGYLWDLYTNYELICLGDAIGAQGLEYVLSDDGTYYTVTGIGTCTDTEIEIPDTYMDKPVKVVADSAFVYCTDITSITVNAETIGQHAFYGCTNLTALTIGSNVTTIGAQAFQACSKLSSVSIEYGVSHIMYDAFSECTSLTSITMPDSVTTIELFIFYGCSKLSNVVLSNNIETIPWKAFGDCTSLKQITIPENVRCIEQQAFSGCTGLTSFVIPDRVEKIEQYAFENCTGMKSVTIGNGVWSIEEHAFVNCTGLTAVHIKDMDVWCYIGFTDAYANPLTYAHKLYLNGSLVTQVILYEYLDWVNYYTFTGCTSITSVVIPEWTTIISEQAFNGCTNLKYVYYAGTASQWKSVTIESGNNTVKNARIYYYSAKRPSSNAGNYWHYVNGVPTVWA